MRRPPRRAAAALLSPFLTWRIVLVSCLFAGFALLMFFYALDRYGDVALARTLVVNTIVVLEIFYLFNVRYLHSTSYSVEGARGTPAVLLAVGGVVAAQFAFTYLPVMQTLFDTRPVDFLDGVLVVATGIVMMAILEVEKAATAWLGRRRRGGRAESGRTAAAGARPGR
jgi:magnesium-transporting ATPase (P-type)